MSERAQQKLSLLDLLLNEEGIEPITSPTISRRSNLDEFPLSFAQKRLWFLNHIEPGPQYNDHFNLRFHGPLQIAALQRSLDEIVRRHEALRVRFVAENGEPVQKIAPSSPLPLRTTDLCNLPEAERMARTMGLAVSEARAPFDLQAGPVLRAKLLRLAEDDHVLLLTLHHIAVDGWSRGVFLRELSELYPAFVSGKNSPLEPLTIQYADFALWQQRQIQDEALMKQLAYWKEQLAGVPALLEWPADFRRPETQTFRGARLNISLPKGLTEQLKELSQREGCTLFMMLMAAFQTLAARYTRQEDFVVGTPIANRNRAEIEGLIGVFVNTLVMRANLSGNPTFREVMSRVRETALAAYANQDLPFEKLVEELHPARSQSYNPIFQTMFILQNAPMAVRQMRDVSIRSFEVDSGTSKFDLTFSLEETADGLAGWIEYSTELFRPESVARMLGHYQTLLEAVVKNPDQTIASLPLITTAERTQMLESWNATRTDYPKDRCVHELFEDQVARAPDNIAVVCGEHQLTYAELNERANQLAHYLRRCGVERGARVGISLDRSIEAIVGLYAILKAGGAYVPLDPVYPRERLNMMIEDAQVKIVLTQAQFAGNFEGDNDLRVICLDSEWKTIARESHSNPVAVTQPDDLIYVIFTSGSTGRPKGAGVRHHAFTNLVHWMTEEFGMNSADRVMFLTALSFDLTQKFIYSAGIRGAQLHIPAAGPYDPLRISNGIEKQKITIINTTPSAFYPLIEPASAELFAKLESLRCLFLGGEGSQLARLRTWLASEQCHAEAINTYGPTECTDNCSAYRLDRSNMDRYEFFPIGKPLYNAQLAIVNSEMQPCPINVPGELCIGGLCVGAGYVNDAAQTAAKFVKNPFSEISSERIYRTGDLARYLPDGNIEFLGRLDYQVKVRGFRVELREIENTLAAHPAISQAVVVLYRVNGDTASEPTLVAYYTSHDGKAADAGELRRFVLQKLPEYMAPSAYVHVEKFALSPNGKVDRKALPAPEQTRPELAASYAAPRTALEKTIAEIWARALRLEKVGVHDNFFELGGHSLLLAQVHARLCEALNRDISIIKLFQFPTISALAAHLTQPVVENTAPSRAQERARMQREALARRGQLVAR